MADFSWSEQDTFDPESHAFLRCFFSPPEDTRGVWRHKGSFCDVQGGVIQLTAGWFRLFSDLTEAEKASLPLQSASFTAPRIDFEPVVATISFEDYLALIDCEEDRRRVRETRTVLLHLPSQSAWFEEFTLFGRRILSRGQCSAPNVVVGWDSLGK